MTALDAAIEATAMEIAGDEREAEAASGGF